MDESRDNRRYVVAFESPTDPGMTLTAQATVPGFRSSGSPQLAGVLRTIRQVRRP